MLNINQLKSIEVAIRGARYFGRHGLFGQERAVGNNFIVNLVISYSAQGEITDEIDGTISYVRLHEIVTEEMAVPSDLLERLAWRIARRIARELPRAETLDIEIIKERAPISGFDGRASVRLRIPG